MLGGCFVLFILLFVALGFAFWIWMLVDCATKEPSEGNDKLIWVLIVVLGHFIGALIYYFVRRPQRYARYGR